MKLSILFICIIVSNIVYAKNCNVHMASDFVRFDQFNYSFYDEMKKALESKGYTVTPHCEAASMEVYLDPSHLSFDRYFVRLTVSKINKCKEDYFEEFLYERSAEWGSSSKLDYYLKPLMLNFSKDFATCEQQSFKPPKKPWF